ncbi:PREDICTED: pro-opiomelanocortin [Elephantulus edwardii]|uniref:pro-opiomelanocortin n=1 Tax=Elephantulus edwardii TaxID=28737 RepID=UPI0003F0A8D0|nr:PREDICTED: pro-opiomelanocortin [Elephantulus edwardii]
MPRSCCSRSGALLLALLLQASVEVRGWCLESSQCQDLTTESNLLGGPGALADGGQAGPHEGKRSYSMEHFRWGKPVGKKRRPVKVYPNVAEDQAADAFPLEFKRELAGERPEPARGPEDLDEAAAALEDHLEDRLEAVSAEKKDDGPYRMEHFRWGSPPKDKRYGGFMGSDKGQTPLVTLFKNAIIKNAHKKGQ